MRKIRNQEDNAWKDIIEVYFKECMELCLPEVNKIINWNKQVTSLDKELQVISRGNIAGKKLVDKLFKVFLNNGEEQWILVHIEVQGTKDIDFPIRMFTYAYRIWDKYQKQLVSCAILTDDNQTWKPTNFRLELIKNSYLECGFLTIKLLDYAKQKLELENSTNPFAAIIYVQLMAIEAQSKTQEERKNIKLTLTKRLYKKGYRKQEINNLYKFIDFLIGLPESFELKYQEEVYEFEESLKMPYITSAEKYGMKKGLELTAKRLLEKGFDLNLIAEVTELPIEKIQLLKILVEETSTH